MKRAYGKLELNDYEKQVQKVYEKLKALGYAQAQKIRDGIKKSVPPKKVTSIIKQLVEEGFITEFKEQGKTFYRISRRNPSESSPLVP